LNKSNNKNIGRIGEQLAYEFLLGKGYTILEQNYTDKKTEIDIIAKHENCLVIIEVKTRSYGLVNPENAVGKTKQKTLIEAALLYQEKNNIKYEIRFDIIAIVLNKNEHEILHFEDAFYPFNTI
jgi:putative endonuclease